MESEKDSISYYFLNSGIFFDLLKPVDFKVYFSFLFFSSNCTESVTKSLDFIAKFNYISVNSLRSSLNRLEQMGYIRKSSSNAGNSYDVFFVSRA